MHILAPILALLSASTVLASAVPDWRQSPLGDLSSPTVDEERRESKRVNVTLYAMSRCPDARMCENVFEDVLKSEGILDKIDLWVDFLGKPDKDAAYGVDCMHGDIECAGNAHQLCLQVQLDQAKFYSILTCMNYGNFPGSIGTVALTRKCVEMNGLQWWESGIGRCIQGTRAEREGLAALRQIAQDGYGEESLPAFFDVHDEDASLEHLSGRARRYLRRSVRRTADAGATKSCTIDIDSTIKHDGRRRCVVDGGVWKGCDDGHTPADFVAVIHKEWAALNGYQVSE